MQTYRQTDTLEEKAGQPGVIEFFRIVNLHGYRTVSMRTPHAAAILIAQNGAGKTTLIGALATVLKGQYSRLRHIDFEAIELKITGGGFFRITKSEIDDFANDFRSSEFDSYASSIELTPAQLFEYLTLDFESGDALRNYYTSTTIFDRIVASENYNIQKGIKKADHLINLIYGTHTNLSRNRKEISKSLQGAEVVYLPTYRRIELALEADEDSPRRRKKPSFKFARDSVFSGSIQFGLSDIAEQLERLNDEIVRQTNDGYRRISASIINDLIEGKPPEARGELPSEDELKIFFSRLSEGPIRAPFYPIQYPKIDKVYSNSEDRSRNPFLNYFLSYLNDVIVATKNTESSVTQFVDICNSYLGASDPSTELALYRRYHSRPIDPKQLVLNRESLSVCVKSQISDLEIPLDSLSSGEKQMISLFAKMYLYPYNKIVLIDEPELSLSLDWQTQILPDIIGSPYCSQLIAITHSPFVFENRLEPFARAIDLQIDGNSERGQHG